MISEHASPGSARPAEIPPEVAATADLQEPTRSPEPHILGELTGDRVCVTCGFNLVGQQIVREPRYGLAVVRCPECSTAAALHEYPSLGRWQWRLAFLSAALYLLILVGMYAGTCGIFAAISIATDEAGIRAAGRIIAIDHKKHYDDAVRAAAEGSGPPPPARAGQLTGWDYDLIDLAWWETADRSRAINAIKPFRPTQLETGSAVRASALALLAIAAGTVWSVALCGVRRRWMWVIAALIAAGAAVVVVLARADTGMPRVAQSAYAYELARELAGIRAPLTVAGYLVVLLLAGLVVGRSIARAMVRFLMPPRHIGLMTFLWECDKLRPPARIRRERGA